MNVEKLMLNNIYTYKELCELFNETKKTSDSKISQLKEWSRYFAWDYAINPKTKKIGTKFIITEIYEVPQPKVDNRKGNSGKNSKGNVKFSKYLVPELWTCCDLIEYNKGIGYIELAQKIGILPVELSLLKPHYSKTEYCDKDNKEVIDYKKKLKDFSKAIILSSCKRLSKESNGAFVYSDTFLVDGENVLTDEQLKMVKEYKSKLIKSLPKKYHKNFWNECMNELSQKSKDAFLTEYWQCLSSYILDLVGKGNYVSYGVVLSYDKTKGNYLSATPQELRDSRLYKMEQIDNCMNLYNTFKNKVEKWLSKASQIDYRLDLGVKMVHEEIFGETVNLFCENDNDLFEDEGNLIEIAIISPVREIQVPY